MRHYITTCWHCNAKLELPLRVSNNVTLEAEGSPHNVFFELNCPRCKHDGKYSLSTFETTVDEQ